MTNYEKLLEIANRNHLVVKEKDLRANKGRIKGNRIAIRKKMSETEKTCVLAEELGHYCTTAGDILDQTIVENRKQEYRARAYAFNQLINLSDIVDAYKKGCMHRYEVAEYLGVTESFLMDAVEYFKTQYGPYVILGSYAVSLDTFGVLHLNL